MRWIVLLLLLVLVAGCVPFTDKNGNNVGFVNTNVGLAATSVQQQLLDAPKVLKAQVKGSIYETGEQVSVFGTCLNASDEAFMQGSYATMSSWYPNGTLFFTDVTMQELQPGYYVYIGSMNAVSGTYLTEMMCHLNGTQDIAKAWGEWQNPRWVQQIANFSNQTFNVNLTNITNQLDNISGQISGLNTTVVNDFNLTWIGQNATNTYINATYQNLTQQIAYVAAVANASVDRNNSYIVQLLQQIIVGNQVPVTKTLNVTVVADPPILHSQWTVTAEVVNEYGVDVGYPLISCFINTTNLPPTVNQLMNSVPSGGNPHGVNTHPAFTWTEKINLIYDFNYHVWCVYN